MFRDEPRLKVWEQIRQQDLPAFSRLLTCETLVEAAQRAGVRVGGGPLSVVMLAWLAVSSALHAGQNFSGVLTLTLKLLSDQPGWSESSLGRRSSGSRKGKKHRSKHDPRGKSLASLSEEAFVQARQRMPLSFWTWLLIVLGERFQAAHPDRVRWKKFRLLMLDGTHLELERDQRLVQHFGTAHNGKKSRNAHAQGRLVMLALAQGRIPWRYELTPWKEHEQTIAHRLLADLQPSDLVLMDRGFWSYGLFWQVAQAGSFFAIRLRRKIPLKTTGKLGAGDRLVTWRPTKKSSRKGIMPWTGLPREMKLRVVEYKIPGFRASAVVTNVLDPAAISRPEWIRLATQDRAGRVIDGGLYHRRWEIETLFHELKVGQGLEGHLRGRTPESIHFEVAGHVVLYLLTRWLMVEAAAQHGLNPLELSFTQAKRELDDIRYALLTATPQRIAQVLLPRLLQRIAEHRIPFRPGRNFPRIKDTYRTQKYRTNCKSGTAKA